MRGSRSADTAASTASVRPSSRSWRSEIPPLSRVSSKEVAKVESRHDHRWWPGSNATESRMIAASFSLVACGSGDADGLPGGRPPWGGRRCGPPPPGGPVLRGERTVEGDRRLAREAGLQVVDRAVAHDRARPVLRRLVGGRAVVGVGGLGRAAARPERTGRRGDHADVDARSGPE